MYLFCIQSVHSECGPSQIFAALAMLNPVMAIVKSFNPSPSFMLWKRHSIPCRDFFLNHVKFQSRDVIRSRTEVGRIDLAAQ